MLKALHLRDFRSFANQPLSFGPLTTITGPNGCGKSNLLDALRFLQGTYQQMHVNDVFNGQWTGGVKTWPGIRGSKMEVPRFGCDSFTLESTWLYRRSGLRIASTVTYKRDSHPGVETHNYFHPAMPTHLRVVEGDEEVIPWADRPEWFTFVIRKVHFFDPRPEFMRSFVEPYMTNIGEHGQNLSSVLYQHTQDATFIPEFTGWLQRLEEPALRSFDFVVVPETAQVLARFTTAGGAQVTVRSLSDGTLRLLAMMAGVLTLPEGSILIIDGLEENLSVANQRLLAEMLCTLTRERDLQVIATTMSDAFLEALDAEARENILRLDLRQGQTVLVGGPG